MGLEYKRWRPAFEDNRVLRQLNIITKKLDKIEKHQMTQTELIAKLQADSAQIIKIGTETRSLLNKIEALLAQIAAGEVSQEVTDAAADVEKQLGVVDELVPDETVKP